MTYTQPSQHATCRCPILARAPRRSSQPLIGKARSSFGLGLGQVSRVGIGGRIMAILPVELWTKTRSSMGSWTAGRLTQSLSLRPPGPQHQGDRGGGNGKMHGITHRRTYTTIKGLPGQPAARVANLWNRSGHSICRPLILCHLAPRDARPGPRGVTELAPDSQQVVDRKMGT